MPQHDYDIANGSGAAFRADLNAVLAAIASTNKGPTPPSTPQAGMLWVEDDNPSATQWTVRMYDGADWIALGVLDAATNSFAPANALLTTGVPAGTAAAPSIAPTGDSNTGIFFPAADTIAFSEGGVEALRLDSSGNATFAGTAAMASSFLRNRIINGGMVVSQRNGTSSVNISSDAYSLDRWLNRVSGGGVITNQQTTSVVPTGQAYAAALTVQTADASIAAGDVYDFEQRIEGFNTADLGWGTANAQTVTLSFWVRSSVTGTYGVGIQSAAYTRSYVTTYTVNAANTWEFKTLTIPGDTSGTQNVGNGLGVCVCFDLGSGSNCNATAGTWGPGGGLWRTSGCVNWIANAGATFYLTGVQLEVGSVATPFERRQYGQELALCQRYFARSGPIYITNPTAASVTVTGQGSFPVTMRASPTLTATNGAGLVVAESRDIGLAVAVAAFQGYSTGTISGNAEL